MCTIYLVNWDNQESYEDHHWGNIQAFNSKEDAERFIIKKNEEYHRDKTRMDELYDIWFDRRVTGGKLTDEEDAEYNALRDKWLHLVNKYDPETEWYIAEIQFQE